MKTDIRICQQVQIQEIKCQTNSDMGAMTNAVVIEWRIELTNLIYEALWRVVFFKGDDQIVSDIEFILLSFFCENIS